MEPISMAAETPATIQPDTAESPVLAEAKTDPFSPKFATLARKEKAIQQRAQQIKAREEALKAKEADYQTSYISKAELSKQVTENPVAFLEAHGLSWDQLTQLALNQPSPEAKEIQRLNAKLEALEGKQNEALSSVEKQQKQAYDQALHQIATEAKLLVETDSNFETIKETESADAIVELIKETFDQKGVLLSVEQAAQQVEEYLVEEALKMAKLKKVALKLQPETPALKNVPSEQIPLKTLTNSMSVSSKPLSEKDRVQRAILAFQGQLK